ncbi:actin depolymerizing protein [Coprinopsis marcescibilis]|uniref:Actin depolymerizing protein n=1 Tax=Coprinopsis marcescibilis TaxID=230819 RepID=A0A5C3LAJ5_COPMA|nr:actin depolymerizing protein [Coprinopsis marcescibilis]
MSATSGIGPSQELTAAFAQAVESNSTRFLKVSIQNETLVHDSSIPISGSFLQDLSILQDDSVVPNEHPAYILAKLDRTSEWLAIFYVPDNAKIRDKMLYASTRSNLLKSLGSALFVDSIFATSKLDITADAYTAHQQHIAAPKPLSSREKDLADLRVSENDAAGYAGSRARVNHIGTGVGLNWSDEAEHAVGSLAQDEKTNLVILSIEASSESLVVNFSGKVPVEELASSLPSSEPCFAFFAWAPQDQRSVVFIYSCPSNSPIKHRMIYSSSSTSTYQGAKSIISNLSSDVDLAARKIETSDPSEINEAYLRSELGFKGDASDAGSSTPQQSKAMFARPKGPARRR